MEVEIGQIMEKETFMVTLVMSADDKSSQTIFIETFYFQFHSDKYENILIVVIVNVIN